MLGWFRALLPREDKFFDLFERHSHILVAGAEALQKLLQGGENVERHGREIVDLENQADEITREVLLAVRKSFITPFDRGDIKDLITSMDDAIDEMQKTAKAINLFELTTFEPDMRAMADAIVQCARLVARAMPLLSNIGQHAGRLNEICLQVTQIEGRGDEIHERGLKILYERSKAGDPMDFVRGQEIYDHLEQVIDSFDNVSDQIQAVVIEHA